MSGSPRRVLVVGGGAREHALASAIVAGEPSEGGSSPSQGGGRVEVFCAPGNAGTARIARNVSVASDDVGGLVELAVRERIELVVVGPEVPLTLGLVDALSVHGIRAFGPTRAAAKLEASKAHMKRFLRRHGIPTAAYEVFDDAALAADHVRRAGRPLVVKADGLAAGKGVVVAQSTEEALEAVERMMVARAFGEAGKTVVIEELLPGEEASFHVVSDGERYLPLVAAQDHKRVCDGDQGPNTGGMGAYAPAPIVTPEVHARVLREIVEPTLLGLRAEGTPFRGALFVGLMIEDGVPRVLEFNVRFGDPETSVLVPLYEGSWLSLLDASARGDLRPVLASGRGVKGAALCVVMAAEGYPGTPRTGDAIEGLEAATALAEVDGRGFVFHAGTASKLNDSVITAGGRVLSVGATASTLEEAATLAYGLVDAITWPGEHHRTDIGYRARGLSPVE